LDAAYSRLGFENGDLVSAAGEPNDGTSKAWLDKGDWLSLAKKVGAEKLFFVNNYPVVVFAEQTSEDPADWFRWFNSVWCMARPQLLFLARHGELSVFNLTKKPARRGEAPGVTRLLDVVRITADVQEKLHRYRRDQVESGRLFEDSRFGFEDRADRALVRDLERVRAALLEEGLAPGYAHALIGRSIFIRYLEDRGVLVDKYFRRIAKTDTSGKWDSLLDEAEEASGENGIAHPIFYPSVLTNKGFTYALFTKLAAEFNGDMFPVNPEEQMAVTEKHLKLLHRFLLGGKDENLFFFAYRFDIIPIELISSIYEKFYTLESKKQRDEGSYYTPAALVEFVLSQSLSEEILAKDPRVLDPACGSGIFLVEAFRRIVRYKVARTRKPPTREELLAILRDQIAGADINPEAIRVAAFSLYLAMLHYLHPPDILQHRLPCLTYSTRHGKKPSKDYDILVAENVFRIEETVSEPAVRARFATGCADVVIGNPPWGKAKKSATEDSGGEEWCAKRGLSVGYRERSETFIHRTLDLLRDGGRAGMLVSTGILFKRHKNTREFRRQWLSAATLQKVVNFAAVRDSFFRPPSEEGGASAKGGIAPFAAVVFDKGAPQDGSRFSYWSAKESAFVKRVQAAILNRADLRVVKQQRFFEDETLWKIHWWGGQRDEAFIRRLRLEPTLRDVIDPGDLISQGFIEGSDKTDCKWLARYPLLPTECFQRYGPIPDDAFAKAPQQAERPRAPSLYRGRRLLIKRGVGSDQIESGRIVARYENTKFSFRHSLYGIPLGETAEETAKVALGILWSSLARYFLFMTSGEWGIWHDALQKEVIHSIPIRVPKRQTLRRRLVKIVDALRTMPPEADEDSIFQEEGAIPRQERERRIHELELHLDEAVYEAFSLTAEERERVEELCGLGLDFFYQGMKSPAVEPLDWDPLTPRVGRMGNLNGRLGHIELAQYVRTFLGLWEPHLASQHGRFRWRIVRPTEASSMMAAIFETETAGEKLPDPTTSDDRAWEEVLKKLEGTTRQHAGPQRVYIDGLIRLVSDEDIVIIKKNERRLWTKSAARDDAEATLVTALQMNAMNARPVGQGAAHGY
jgi:hypothetical protein